MKSQKAVNYRTGDENGSCATCAFFESPNKCSQVSGDVAADGMCDIYQPKQEQAAPDQQAITDMLFGGGLPNG